MTFTAAVAGDDFALVANDSCGYNMARIAAGWVTTTGRATVCVGMVERIEHLPAARLDEAADILAAYGAERIAAAPNDPQTRKATILLAYRDPTFQVAAFSADGAASRRAGCFMTFPLGVTDDVADAAWGTFRRWLHEGRGPWETIRRVAAVCADAAARAPLDSSVRGEMEVGLTLGERELYLGSTPASEIQAARDKELETMFREVTDVAA